MVLEAFLENERDALKEPVRIGVTKTHSDEDYDFLIGKAKEIAELVASYGSEIERGIKDFYVRIFDVDSEVEWAHSAKKFYFK